MTVVDLEQHRKTRRLQRATDSDPLLVVRVYGPIGAHDDVTYSVQTPASLDADSALSLGLATHRVALCVQDDLAEQCALGGDVDAWRAEPIFTLHWCRGGGRLAIGHTFSQEESAGTWWERVRCAAIMLRRAGLAAWWITLYAWAILRGRAG